MNPKKRKYLSEIVEIDRALGRLRRKLRELKIADQTVLWYAADNGGKEPFANNGDFRGEKGTLWEGGLRVPSVIEWPDHVMPRSTDVVATTSDIYPTVLDLANVEADYQPQPIDGTSLLPFLKQKQTKRQKPIGFWAYPERGRNTPNTEFMTALHKEQVSGDSVTVRVPVIHPPEGSYPKAENRAGWAVWLDGNWKLHRHTKPNRYRRSGRYSLYNIAKDPGEQHNRIDDFPERAVRMKRELRQWQQSVTESLYGSDY